MQLRCEKCKLISTPPDDFNPFIRNYECPNCGGQHFETHSDTVICDFCCYDKSIVVASYPARDFTMPVIANVDAGMRGWWAACADCRYLIEQGDRQKLAERSADAYINKGEARSIPRPLLVKSIRDLHDQFWSNREGPVCDHGPLAPEQTQEFRG